MSGRLKIEGQYLSLQMPGGGRRSIEAESLEKLIEDEDGWRTLGAAIVAIQPCPKKRVACQATSVLLEEAIQLLKMILERPHPPEKENIEAFLQGCDDATLGR